MKKPPCYECKTHTPTCHAECVAYREWAAEIRAIKHKAWMDASGRREARERFGESFAARQRRKHMNGR